MNTLTYMHKILTAAAICLAAVGLESCRFHSVEKRGPVIAFSYHQNGSVDKAYYFSEKLPYPDKLGDWIEYNNGKLYYATMVSYAPEGICLLFPSQQLHFSFRSDIVYDGSNYRSLTPKDKEFLAWLKSLPWLSNQASDNYTNSSLFRVPAPMPPGE